MLPWKLDHYNIRCYTIHTFFFCGCAGGRRKKISQESLAGRNDNYKMSEDTLLHRKLSTYFFNHLNS